MPFCVLLLKLILKRRDPCGLRVFYLSTALAGWTMTLSAQTVTITEYPAPTNVLQGMTPGSDGALWFAEQSIGRIGRATTDGIVTEYPLPDVNNSRPTGITTGPDGALWFTEYTGNKIGRITTSGDLTEYSVPTGGSLPWGIITGPDGALWFAESGTNKIGRITTGGTFKEYPVPTSGTPQGITVGLDGALWFTETVGFKIGRITTGGTITEFPLPTGIYAFGITNGPDGALWFTAPPNNQIGRITTAGLVTLYTAPTAGTYPYYIIVGPDKALWFSELNGNQIGRISTSGTIIEYPTPTPNSNPTGIAVGSDGAVWFLEFATAKIGRLLSSSFSPFATTSYYVTTTKSSTLFNMGRDLAQSQVAANIPSSDLVVALLFGAPTLVGGQYGATGFRANSIPVSDIASLAEDFASGYYNSLGSNQSLHARIVIATSNSGDKVTYSHGQAWGQMVNAVASWTLGQGYSGQVDIAGGSDIEPGFNGPATTRAWVDGYSSVAARSLYDLGDAAGCRQSGTTASAGNCNNGWTQEDVWYVSWGSNPSRPLPEIYRRDGAMAAQWASVSLYGYLAHGENVTMAGALTQAEACQQNGCDQSTRNTPAQGWHQLDDKLNADVRTAQTVPWSTDIKWSSK